MQEDMMHMEYLDSESGLIFQWESRTQIKVGRPWEDRLDGGAPEGERPYQWSYNISVYDHETGKVTIPTEYEAFKARCLEWLEDMREAGEL
ncbi:hypothetical protein OIE82_27050 [Streptomyces althioticus]|uniref:Uncharacterized protein n=1 Tax=Streptomyces althioticus TaxID=83380 RepID=A0ABZ1YD75_9ACTN